MNESMDDGTELEQTARTAYDAFREAHGLEPQWVDLDKRNRHAWFDVVIAVLSGAMWRDDR